MNIKKTAYLIASDLRFQLTYGFYFIYAVLCVFYICLLYLFPVSWREKIAVIMIYSDPAAIGFFFMGAIILLEKSQRVLNALAVSPMRPADYIISKVIALAITSAAAAAIIAGGSGMSNFLSAAAAAAVTSVIFTLAGLIIATRISSLNQFILATVPFEILLLIPPVFYVLGYQDGFMRWYPANICIAFISGMNMSFPQDIIPNVIILIAVITGLFFTARHFVSNMWKSAGGVTL